MWVVREHLAFDFGGAKSMAMKFHGNIRGNVRVNFLDPFASKPHIFMCGALKLLSIVRASVRLNFAVPSLFCQASPKGSMRAPSCELWRTLASPPRRIH